VTILHYMEDVHYIFSSIFRLRLKTTNKLHLRNPYVGGGSSCVVTMSLRLIFPLQVRS
jgi:hypothetical protein